MIAKQLFAVVEPLLLEPELILERAAFRDGRRFASRSGSAAEIHPRDVIAFSHALVVVARAAWAFFPCHEWSPANEGCTWGGARIHAGDECAKTSRGDCPLRVLAVNGQRTTFQKMVRNEGECSADVLQENHLLGRVTFRVRR